MSLVEPDKPVTLGRPVANTQFFVLDRRRQPVPPGTPGELYIGGDGVARGYHRRPGLTGEKFIAHPFDGSGGRLYRTGDLVRLLRDGRFEFIGRADRQIKLNGYRIELDEIEHALATDPSVRAAAVVLREDVPGDRRLVAYWVPREPSAPSSPDALRHRLSATLPVYMIPAVFVSVERLPLTLNGKVDRKSLPLPLQVQSQSSPDGIAAGHAPSLERQIAAIWRRVLQSDRFGLDDNFFDAGGNSLQLMRVLLVIRSQLREDIMPADMFKHPTVRAMARHLEGETRGRGMGPRTLRGHTLNTPAAPRSTRFEPGAQPAEVDEDEWPCRTQTCSLDEGHPGIFIDDQGVCNLCRLDVESGLSDNLKYTQESYERFRRSPPNPHGPYDCLLLYSGGKDSTYMLDRFVNEEGRRVLAYTFDVPFESKRAAENVELAKARIPATFMLDKDDANINRVMQAIFNRPAPKRPGKFLDEKLPCASAERSSFFAPSHAYKNKIPYVILCADPQQILTMESNVREVVKGFYRLLGVELAGELFQEELEQLLFAEEDELPRIVFPFIRIRHQYDPERIVAELKAKGLYRSSPIETHCKLFPLLELLFVQELGLYVLQAQRVEPCSDDHPQQGFRSFDVQRKAAACARHFGCGEAIEGRPPRDRCRRRRPGYTRTGSDRDAQATRSDGRRGSVRDPELPRHAGDCSRDRDRPSMSDTRGVPVDGVVPAADGEGSNIAVVGMACRFPGAPTIEAFWRNLTAARDSAVTLSD